MKDAMVLRNGLAPYIYTAVRAAYDSGVGLLRPMYYSNPEEDDAYKFSASQYLFGEDMLIAPITEAGSAPVNGTVSKSVWLPAGSWTDFYGEKILVGPTVHTADYTQADVPVFVRAGAVVPMKTMASVASPSPDPLVWLLFPAVSSPDGANSGEMYEDDGETTAAKAEAPGSGGHSAVTSVTWSGGCSTGDRLELSITTRGSHTAMVAARRHALQLRGCKLPPRTATVNGAVIAAAEEAQTTTSLAAASVGDAPIVEPTGELGWSLQPAPTDSPHDRSLVSGAAALHVGLGEHPTAGGAAVTVVLEF